MARPSFTRWNLAGAVRRWVPDVRGRDRVFAVVRGADVPRALLAADSTIRFGPGLRATVPLDADGSFVDVFFAAYEDPALVPILEATLAPGACFYDVGANIGVYSLWADRLVGASGTVVAFEPVPATRSWLEMLIDQNGADVTVVPVAVSDHQGTVTIETMPTASGRSRIRPAAAEAADPLASGLGGHQPAAAAPDRVAVDSSPFAAAVGLVTVDTRTLDDVSADFPWPTLVKIDVEGHELSVFCGMEAVLREAQPAVVFECPDTVGAEGDTAAILELLRNQGYRTWSLTQAGLRPTEAGLVTHNVLALVPGRHDDVRDRLLTCRFRRNQNC